MGTELSTKILLILPIEDMSHSVPAFLVRNSNAVSSLSLGTFYVLMSLADVTQSEGASVEGEAGLGR